MKLHDILQQQLKKDPHFLSANETLKKQMLIDKARNCDQALITLLLQHEALRENFFLRINGTLVFNQNRFLDFLEQKNYLGDNCTKFKNKTGNIASRLSKQKNEAVLIWPYKNCILEGGLTKAEQKREEIYFSETLEQDEINHLLEPKVLTNARRIDKKGELSLDCFRRDTEINRQRGLPPDTITDNLIIRGNNLFALHSLKKEFTGKVKLIYIDPPYNTGNDAFNYHDNFNRSTWLTFMRNRLEIAKILLHQQGTVFAQCDDHEQAYLKVLMDEIFGSENYRETIVVKTSTPSGVNAINVKRGERLFKVKEYLLFYSKSPEFRFNPIYIKSTFNPNYRYEVIKNKDGYTVKDLKQKFQNEKDLEKYALEHYENIYSLEKNNKKAGEKIKAAIARSKKIKTVMEHINTRGQLVLIYEGGVLIPLKERIVRESSQNYFGTLISDLWDDEIFQTNRSEGGVNLPGGKKPEKLIKRILELTTREGDLVLDYHLGSGTTAAVAHKMKRQYIGIEQLDYGQNDSVVRLKKVIEGEQTGISKSVNWKGGGSFVYFELKRYNQTFVGQIEAANSTQTLLQIWDRIKTKSFFRYSIELQRFEKKIEAFKRFKLKKQKEILCDLLAKNQLYVNLSALCDPDSRCSDSDIAATTQFYNLQKSKT